MKSKYNLNIILDAFKNNKPIQSMIFVGPQYSFKFQTAKELAKSLNCLATEFSACNECFVCKKIESEEHPDFHVYGSEGEHIKISDIHDLQKFINLGAYQARKRVFIIKDAHNLTNDAANCLLKTLEEPTKGALIILTTSKISRIFPTITSRCQKFYFSASRKNNLEKFSLESKAKIIDAVFIKKDLVKNFAGLDDKQEFKMALEIILSVLRDILFLKLGSPVDDLINLDRLDLLKELDNGFSYSGILKIFSEISEFALLTEHNINSKLILDTLILKVDTYKSLRV